MSQTQVPGVIVRAAQHADLEDVARLRLQFLAAHRGVTVESFVPDFVDQTVGFLRRQVENGTIHSWLAESEGALMGGVSMLVLDLAPRPEDASGQEGYIINMYVDPAHRRRGIGQLLLNQCLDSADQLSLRRLLLYSTDDGRHMYSEAGFAPNPKWMELHR